MTTIEDVKVKFDSGEWVYYFRASFKDGGWLAIHDGDEWNYYPPHRIERVRSIQTDE